MAGWKRIVVGGDTTPGASAALRWAVRESALHDTGCVVVVHAFDVAGTGPGQDGAPEHEGGRRSDDERDLARARREARYRTQSWVVQVLRDLHASVPVVVRTPDGSVEDALASASRTAAMVVVGEPRQRPDLVERLCLRCSCPVVTVGFGKPSTLVGRPGLASGHRPHWERSVGSTFSP